MNRERMIENKLKNLLHTVTLMGVMAAVTGLAAYMVAGPQGVWIALFALGLPLVFSRGAGTTVLRMRGARPLHPQRYSRLYQMAAEIAQRAGLERVPQLYLEPSKMMNAYATGTRENPVIVFTDTLMRNLDIREVAGILGHETAHIRNSDLKVMSVTDSVRRITGVISMFGQIALLLSIPLIISGKASLYLAPVLFIVFAPTLVLMLQMAISRTREFEADRVGCKLTGDPAGLAQALYKLERYQQSIWRRFIFSPMVQRAPSWLQTHPPTEERIERLMELKDPEERVHWPAGYHSSWGNRITRIPGTLRQLHCINC